MALLLAELIDTEVHLMLLGTLEVRDLELENGDAWGQAPNLANVAEAESTKGTGRL